MISAVAEQRFWSHVDKSDDCWRWTGYVNERGYGRVCIAYRLQNAHRVAWALVHGPIPEGGVIDHTCHNADSGCPGGPECRHRSCVNPEHLELVGIVENVMRGRVGDRARRTHCKHGHEFTEGNTYWPPGGGRVCRTCKSQYDVNYRRRRALLSA